MSVTLHGIVLPTITQILGSLETILDKAIIHAETRKIDPSVLVNYRLAPDMFPLSRQIQIASDHAKNCVARLTGTEAPAFPDDEASLDELKARVGKTLAYVAGFKAAAFEGSEARKIELKFPNGMEFNFTGETYVTRWFLPNFYFHATTAYDILRHAGVDLGKRDFLGKA
jgi:hypothetical protein